MKTPDWNQKVLLISKDIEITKKISDSFGAETNLTVENNFDTIKKIISAEDFHVMIVDAQNFKIDNVVDPKTYLEICDRSSHKDPGLVIIVLTNKALLENKMMAQLSGVTATVNRRDFSIHQLHFIIRAFRKRSFRAVVWKDIPLGYTPPVELYHYLPLNKRYALAIGPEKEFTQSLKNKLEQQHCYQLFAKGGEIRLILGDLKLKYPNADLVSLRIRNFRRKYKHYLSYFFNFSMEGNLHDGRIIFDLGNEIINDIKQTLNHYPNKIDCLKEVPFERYSDLAHPLNIAVYILVWGEYLNIPEAEMLAHVALVHNLGLSDIPQDIVLKEPQERSAEETSLYKTHVDLSVAHTKRMRLPFESWCHEVILQHHECFDGSGYPFGLKETQINQLAQVLSIAGAFDHHRALLSNDSRSDLMSVWNNFKSTQQFENPQTHRPFNQELINNIDKFFE